MATPLPDAQVYAKQLLLKRHGYPLWVPEPYGNSVTYRTKGIRIGDVGYVTPDGAFETLFNLRASRTDPINFRGVPEGFEPVYILPEDIVHLPNYHQPDSTITNATAKSRAFDVGLTTPDLPTSVGAHMGVQYTWSASEGAILHLPDGAARLSCPAEFFRDVALRNCKSWYKFANITLRRGVPNGALYLVTSCDKTRSWMVGSFCDTSSESQASFKLDAAGFGGGHASYSYSWETSSPAVFRVGPPPPIDSPDTLFQHGTAIDRDNEIFHVDAPAGQNQCVFIRGYRMMLRANPMSLMLGGSTKVEVSSISGTSPKDLSYSAVKCPFTNTSRLSSEGHCVRSDYGSRATTINTPFSSEGPIDDEIMVEYFPDSSDPYHPSQAINNYLLSIAPHAAVVITHDDDWLSVLKDTDLNFPDERILIPRIMHNSVVMNSNTFAFFCPKNLADKHPVSGVSTRTRREQLFVSSANLVPPTSESTFGTQRTHTPSNNFRTLMKGSDYPLVYTTPVMGNVNPSHKNYRGLETQSNLLLDVSNLSHSPSPANGSGNVVEYSLIDHVPNYRYGPSKETTVRENELATHSPRGLPKKHIKFNGRPRTAPNPPTYIKGETTGLKTVRKQRSFNI